MLDMNIGKRIKQRRLELGLTQTQVFEYVGINSGNLSKIENGKVLPSSSSLIGLSEILQCSVDYILKGESAIMQNANLCNNAETNTFDITPSEECFVNCLRQLPASEQDEVIQFMNLKIRSLKRDPNQLVKLSNSAQGEDSETA